MTAGACEVWSFTSFYVIKKHFQPAIQMKVLFETMVDEEQNLHVH